MSGTFIELVASDGHTFAAYENKPLDATASVVIVQEIFGVNPHIRSVVDRYAAAGYHAVAPATFDRAERNVELDYNAEGIERGRELAMGLDMTETLLDLRAVIDYLAGTGPVGLVGYCYGGTVAWLAASSLPVDVAVGYYGGQIPALIDRAPEAPVMLHFGSLDAGIPLEGVATIQERYAEVPVHIYEGADHGFNCDARASFHPEAAAQARERTMDFLASHLRPD